MRELWVIEASYADEAAWRVYDFATFCNGASAEHACERLTRNEAVGNHRAQFRVVRYVPEAPHQ